MENNERPENLNLFSGITELINPEYLNTINANNILIGDYCAAITADPIQFDRTAAITMIQLGLENEGLWKLIVKEVIETTVKINDECAASNHTAKTLIERLEAREQELLNMQIASADASPSRVEFLESIVTRIKALYFNIVQGIRKNRCR